MQGDTGRAGKAKSPNSGTGTGLELVRRLYSPGGRPGSAGEWSTWISDGRAGWYVPLGVSDESEAAGVADRLREEVAAGQWDRVGGRIPREFTLAVFWLESPVACTYTSLHTVVGEGALPGSTAAPIRLQMAVVEPDPVFRASLCAWFGRLPGCSCTGWEDERAWLAQPRRQAGLQVVLVNRLSPAFNSGRLKPGLAGGATLPFVFGYSLHPDSDSIFASVSGVEGGYYLRRRSADELLDPLSGSFASGRLVAGEVPRLVRRYFQSLFHAEAGANTPGNSLLTQRERQVLVCLQRGLHDKEIAGELGISPLTVHTHLKHIFEKLGAHTRTEAVVKYLEK